MYWVVFTASSRIRDSSKLGNLQSDKLQRFLLPIIVIQCTLVRCLLCIVSNKTQKKNTCIHEVIFW